MANQILQIPSVTTAQKATVASNVRGNVIYNPDTDAIEWQNTALNWVKTADDSLVLHTTGNESASGIKEFTGTVSANVLTITGSASGTSPIASFSSTSAGNFLNFGGSGRNIGSTSGGVLFLTRNLDWDTTSSSYKYTGSGSAASAIELSNGVLSLKTAAIGNAGNAATLNTGLSVNSSGVVNIPNLTAAQVVITDGSKNLSSLAYGTSSVASSLVQRDGSGNFNATTATTLQTPRAIYGNNFDGSAALTQIIASTFGGTGNGFTKFSGAATTEKTYTLPNATCSILTTNAAVTETQGGTGQSTYAQGDILYSSSANVLSKLPKNTTATRYLSNTGASNNPAWAQIDLTNGVTGILPNINTTATNLNTASSIVSRDASGNFTAGTITAALNGNASTVTTNANLTGDVTSVGNATAIASGVIVNADINASAAIADTKLATISTAGKVSNSATTATNLNTASAIVARDASGNFTAGTITAALSGNATTATTATTATNSTNIGITNDTTTNATMYPLWVTSTTGNLPAKVSSTKLSFNPSTGVFSSTGLTITNEFAMFGGLPSYMCRAYVNFNGTGTVSMRNAANVSSVGDNGVGDYTINFTSAMPDVNYVFLGSNSAPSGDTTPGQPTINDAYGLNTSALRINVRGQDRTTLLDRVQVMVAIFR